MFNETTSGLGDVNLNPTQQQIAARIVEIGRQRGASEKQIQAALSAGWVESRFRNLTYGDRDSLGVFQQRPSQGWGSPGQINDLDYAINAFYDAAARVNDSSMDFGQLAQAVQRSGFPLRYGQAGGIVQQILNALGSISGASGAGGSSSGSDADDAGGFVFSSDLPADVTTAPVDFFSGAPAWLPVVAIGAAVYFLFR